MIITTLVERTDSVGIQQANCPSGTTERKAREGELANGTLRASFCQVAGMNRVQKVWVQYQKDSGSTLEVRLGWRNTSSRGTSEHHQNFWRTWQYVSPGYTVTSTFEYGGLGAPLDFPCWRGIMQDKGQGNWITGHRCF